MSWTVKNLVASSTIESDILYLFSLEEKPGVELWVEPLFSASKRASCSAKLFLGWPVVDAILVHLMIAPKTFATLHLTALGSCTPGQIFISYVHTVQLSFAEPPELIWRQNQPMTSEVKRNSISHAAAVNRCVRAHVRLCCPCV